MSRPPIVAERGFVYVATGKAYVEEAADSARSLKKFNSEPICLVTNTPTEDPAFDSVVVLTDLPNNVSSKLAMDHCPFERFVFLDSDTLILSSLHELFDLLDQFDVGVPASLGGYHYTLPGVSLAFREASTNVIAMRRGSALSAFFEKWQHYYKAYEKEMGREWDQRSFRHAAYEIRELRICFLGDEWSLSPYPGGLLCRDVRILHGRPRPYLHTMAQFVNQQLGYRVFWRGLNVIGEPYQCGPGEWLRVAWRSLVLAAKAVVRPVTRRMKGR